jgi:hypothetical protein
LRNSEVCAPADPDHRRRRHLMGAVFIPSEHTWALEEAALRDLF